MDFYINLKVNFRGNDKNFLLSGSETKSWESMEAMVRNGNEWVVESAAPVSPCLGSCKGIVKLNDLQRFLVQLRYQLDLYKGQFVENVYTILYCCLLKAWHGYAD